VPDYNQLLRAGAGAGYFDPAGSPLSRERYRRGLLRTGRNRRRRGEVTARLAGLDPQQQRAQLFDLERDIGRDYSESIGRGELEDIQSREGFFRNLMLQSLPYQEAARRRKGAGFRNFLKLAGGVGSLFIPGIGLGTGILGSGGGGSSNYGGGFDTGGYGNYG